MPCVHAGSGRFGRQTAVERSATMANPVRVLIVDDEPAIRHAVEAALTDEGFVVATAPDGAAALAALATARPDAILLDLRMPVMDGYAFLTAYLSRPAPRAAVIVCSTASNAAGVVGMGAAGYLRKPFDIDELIALINRVSDR
jgi:DNA-binding response OmpR family regulator